MYNPQFEKIGKILMLEGFIGEDQLEQALEHAPGMGARLGRVLMELGFISEDNLVAGLAKQMGVDFLTSEEILTASQEAVRVLNEDFARANIVIPVRIEDGILHVAMADPDDIVAVDNIKKSTDFTVKLHLGGEQTIIDAIGRTYVKIRKTHDVEGAIEDLQFLADPDAESADAGMEIDVEKDEKDAPLVKLVTLMITEAIQDRATDIHVEPQDTHVRVRYRIDGVLMEVMTPPLSSLQGIVSRIKILSKLNIAERRLPQDGRFTVKMPDREVDVRVSILPTVLGEKVVMRLLDKSGFSLDLRNLGFPEDRLRTFERWIRQPYGMVIISGPTGSGKSTTLYASLNEIKSIQDNITTVEDPVEYQISGINQVQLRDKIGLTFAASLRSILRQDPDTLLIGEIRDPETADIAIKFALTGHLVFTTLHANDAPSTITRLIDLDVAEFLAGSVVNLVMAQRLVRKICKKCIEEYTPTEEDWHLIGEDPGKHQGVKLYRGTGCAHCRNTGYAGRTGIFEILEVKQNIRKLIFNKANQEEIREQAVENGMISLHNAGLQKMLEGVTTLEEVKRATVEDF